VRLGVIADTHGLLRPQVFEVFREVDRILHAGDVGKAEILADLEALAPVTAVYGNVDPPELRARLPQVAELELDGFAATSSGAPRPPGSRRRFPGARSSCTATPTGRCSSWWTGR
jgi:putative phosphoesterase